LASLLVVAASASPLAEQEAFQAFKTEYDKTYKNQVEETARFAIFSKNLREIEEHNGQFTKGLVSYEKGITRFSDMTQEEFVAMLNLQIDSKPVLNSTEYVPTGLAAPASIDWRSHGQVTGVKDQKQCGSCWAFSVVGSTEGAYYRRSKKLVSFSEQQLVDCTTSFNHGCSGGQVGGTFPYIQRNGLESEANYPYKAANGKCAFDSRKVVTKIRTYTSIKNNERNLHEAVGTVGPVSVTIDASHFGSYKSGVFFDSKCSTTNLNHAVLVVGYGSERGRDYWLIKNSWGSGWGERGYLKLLRGSNACGVAVDDVYPTV